MQTEELKTKTVKVLHCLRCGGEWEAKFPDRLPKTCRWCNSPYWNKERVQKVKHKKKYTN